MRRRILPAFLIASTVAAASFPPNANHIFNAIHSSMRQWGSSLNHNGMSFFLASVPAGTQFYHGNARADPVEGPEWLAFEPEHALVFAHAMHHNAPPPPPSVLGNDGSPPPLQLQSRHRRQHPGGERGKEVGPGFGIPTPDDDPQNGFLHTFAAKKDLRLLYVDGTSAGKTNNGTLDSQDRILFRDQLGKGRGIMDEHERAELFCRMARETWDDRLDGLIRMEAGFEIILCDFARDMDLLRVTRVKPRANKAGTSRGNYNNNNNHNDDKGRGSPDFWLTGVASRYHGIGGSRVTLNYDHFVTAYAYGLDLFNGEGNLLPRLAHLSGDELEPIRRDLDLLIRTQGVGEVSQGQSSTDWQAIVDIIVLRYASRLRYLASGGAASLEVFREEVEGLLMPFIDYDHRNASAEVERCAMHYLRRSSLQATSLAAQSVFQVSRSICETLRTAWDETRYSSAIRQIQELMQYLSWTTWKECNGCGDHEICVIPMWPMGTVNDYEHPQCRDIAHLSGEGPRYWGGGGPPRGRKSALSPELILSKRQENWERR